MTISGTHGDDTLTGTDGNDTFDLRQGGNDTAQGLDGKDTFLLGSAFTAADSIDGGGGTADVLNLHGDYSAGVTFAATTLVDVEIIFVAAGDSYNFTSIDATVAAGAQLKITGSTLGAADTLTFNGSAETDGTFFFVGGAGNDMFTGGAGGDTFDLTHGGHDTATGNGGNDKFNFAAALEASDRISGGAGSDTVTVKGDYTSGLVLTSTLMSTVERLVVGTGHNNAFTSDDTLIAAGDTFTVDGSGLSAASRLQFTGSAETDGHFHFTGGLAPDLFIGGAQSDIFDLTVGGNDNVTGGGGADKIEAGPGHDVFTYNGVADSASLTHDTITGFDPALGRFNLDVTVTGVNAAVSGAVNFSTFDANLASAIGATMGAHHAIVVNATSGSLSGHVFLVVDANGSAAYDGGADYVFDITGATNIANLAKANFI
jgi:Ca2+-binding RTX toxin-like protein